MSPQDNFAVSGVSQTTTKTETKGEETKDQENSKKVYLNTIVGQDNKRSVKKKEKCWLEKQKKVRREGRQWNFH